LQRDHKLTAQLQLTLGYLTVQLTERSCNPPLVNCRTHMRRGVRVQVKIGFCGSISLFTRCISHFGPL